LKQITLIIFLLSFISVKSQKVDTLQSFWTEINEKKGSIQIIPNSVVPNTEKTYINKYISEHLKEILNNLKNNISYNNFNPHINIYGSSSNKAMFYFFGNHKYTFWKRFKISNKIEYLISFTYFDWGYEKKIYISAFPYKVGDFNNILSPFDIISKVKNKKLNWIELYYDKDEIKFFYNVGKSNFFNTKNIFITIDCETNKIIKIRKEKYELRLLSDPAF